MPDRRLIYEEPAPLSREEAEAALSSGTADEVVDALVSVALNEQDFDFALDSILGKTGDENENVRGVAMLCLGHLARIHRRLPRDPTVDVLQRGLKDPSAYVRGKAEDATGDIEVFLPDLGRLIRG